MARSIGNLDAIMQRGGPTPHQLDVARGVAPSAPTGMPDLMMDAQARAQQALEVYNQARQMAEQAFGLAKQQYEQVAQQAQTVIRDSLADFRLALERNEQIPDTPAIAGAKREFQATGGDLGANAQRYEDAFGGHDDRLMQDMTRANEAFQRDAARNRDKLIAEAAAFRDQTIQGIDKDEQAELARIRAEESKPPDDASVLTFAEAAWKEFKSVEKAVAALTKQGIPEVRARKAVRTVRDELDPKGESREKRQAAIRAKDDLVRRAVGDSLGKGYKPTEFEPEKAAQKLTDRLIAMGHNPSDVYGKNFQQRVAEELRNMYGFLYRKTEKKGGFWRRVGSPTALIDLIKR